MKSQSKTIVNDPLHGITLKSLLTEMVELYGFDGLAERINIRCFNNNPSVKSSLTFLRKTPWAREKLERLYLNTKGIAIPPHLLNKSNVEQDTRSTTEDTSINQHIWGNK